VVGSADRAFKSRIPARSVACTGRLNARSA